MLGKEKIRVPEKFYRTIHIRRFSRVALGIGAESPQQSEDLQRIARPGASVKKQSSGLF